MKTHFVGYQYDLLHLYYIIQKQVKKFLLLLLFFSCMLGTSGQNTIGLPDIINFSNLDYHGGTQTWSIKQAKNGVLFFANNDGLLSFDGNYWKQYSLPNKTIIRSLVIDSATGNIYIGSQAEIGFFAPGPNGDLVYNSLKKLIPEGLRDFADIWHIEVYGNAVFFRANQKIFEYKDNTIRVFKAPAEWRYMRTASSRLFAQDRNMGILEFKNNSWQPVCNHPVLKDGLVTSILDYHKDTMLVTTQKSGIFLLHGSELIPKQTAADLIFKADRIYCAIRTGKEEFAIGTTSGGCYIINSQGELIQTISRVEGLQNNNILCMFLDKSQNLWMGLDNGIDFVAYNTAIRRILPDKRNQLATYAIRIINNQLYIGTSDGLYSVPVDFTNPDLSFSKGNFTRIPNTGGQVWRVEDINNQILLGHHEGTFVIKNNQPTPLLPGIGSWLYAAFPFPENNLVVAGTYTGLHLLDNSRGNFTDRGKIEGITESLRFIVLDNENTLWSSHPYKGVYKIVLSPDKKSLTYKLYTQKDGLPSDLNNYVYTIKSKVVAATQKGIYEYNAATGKFAPSAILPPVFNGQAIQYLVEDAEGNIWFESDKKIGVIDYHKSINSETFSILYFPELTNKLVRGFEYIYPYNADNIFIGSEKGAFHLNYRNYLSRVAEPVILIGKVRAIGKTDSVIYGGFGNMPPGKPSALPHSWNSLHFEYSSPQYHQENNIEYSYKLTGFEDQWSAWTKKAEKDYTNLPYGSYTFMVKARTNFGRESAPVAYPFRIRPAWYQTTLAYLFYFLILLLLVYTVVRRQKKKFKQQQEKYAREQDHLKYMYQLEMDRNEKEIVKLQNEKLETDITFKTRELANATMHLVERGKLLSKIKEELLRIQKNIPGGAPVDFKRLINTINDAEKNDNYWDQFISHFDQVHSNYLTLLKARFPVLTTTDLKLCAYLRINLSSKEISQLMNISVRGVEIARYRLRKKLNIPTDENLFDFLINIKMEG
jgi:DNA-binding CsgD family transcriptional regulator